MMQFGPRKGQLTGCRVSGSPWVALGDMSVKGGGAVRSSTALAQSGHFSGREPLTATVLTLYCAKNLPQANHLQYTHK